MLQCRLGLVGSGEARLPPSRRWPPQRERGPAPGGLGRSRAPSTQPFLPLPPHQTRPCRKRTPAARRGHGGFRRMRPRRAPVGLSRGAPRTVPAPPQRPSVPTPPLFSRSHAAAARRASPRPPLPRALPVDGSIDGLNDCGALKPFHTGVEGLSTWLRSIYLAVLRPLDQRAHSPGGAAAGGVAAAAARAAGAAGAGAASAARGAPAASRRASRRAAGGGISPRARCNRAARGGGVWARRTGAERALALQYGLRAAALFRDISYISVSYLAITSHCEIKRRSAQLAQNALNLLVG
jgi:hypothetical protein